MSAGVVVGDGSQITAGTAQVLIDGRDVGYCKGKLAMAREVENLIVEAGIPKSTVAQIFLKENYNLEIPMIQVNNMDNLSLVMGIDKRVQDDTPVVVAFGGSPSESQSYTFASRNGSVPKFIRLRGLNISSVTVKNAAEDTTYDEGDDYIIFNAASGLIMATPGGALASGTPTVHVAYTHTPVEFEELLLGGIPDFAYHEIDYLHVSPNGGWLLHYKFWRTQGDGSVDLSFDSEASEPMVALGKLKAYNDSANHPASSSVGPTGFIRLVPAAQVEDYLATIEVVE